MVIMLRMRAKNRKNDEIWPTFPFLMRSFLHISGYGLLHLVQLHFSEKTNNRSEFQEPSLEHSDNQQLAVQIDLLIERADRVVNVCEMKYCSGEYVLKKEEDLKIRNRIEAYKSESNTKCAVMPVLVTTYGLQKNTYSGNIRNVIVMDDLFAK